MRGPLGEWGCGLGGEWENDDHDARGYGCLGALESTRGWLVLSPHDGCLLYTMQWELSRWVVGAAFGGHQGSRFKVVVLPLGGVSTTLN